jgi:hypothetical protein
MKFPDVRDIDGHHIGVYRHLLHTEEGDVVVVERDESYGGGEIALPENELKQRNGVWTAPYGEVSVREAPPYSPNVNLEAYLEFWKRLGARNVNIISDESLPTGSGPVASDEELPDEAIAALVRERLEEASHEGIAPHLVEVSVRNGTVLLEGYQMSTVTRLAAAKIAASVPGVREIVNMLVVRAT